MKKQQTQKPIAATALTFLLFGLTACQTTPQTSTKTENSGESTTKPTSAASLPGKGVTMTAAYNTPGQRFIAEVFDMGLEKLGYQVNPKLLAPALMYAALANGEVNFSPTHVDAFAPFFKNKEVEKKIEIVGLITPNGLQGYQIDKKTADQYKITKIDQLKDPKIAKIFDTDGDGKANLSGCPAGSGCDEDINYHLKAYGLQATVKQDQADLVALLSNVIANYKQGKPVLLYSWTPSWQNTVLKLDKDVVWLEVPFTAIREQQGKFTEKDTTVNGKNLGFPVDKYRVVANKEFLAANPTAKRLFELIQISNDDLSAELYRTYQGKSKPEEVRQSAEEWIKKNQKLFDSWVEEARKEGKAAG
jgi:glycine betaine/proline transport system substrate-binding protein